MGKLSGKVVEASAMSKAGSVKDVGPALKNLRELSGLTQTQMAARLQVQQAAVSKIERGGDTHLSTIEKYVNALGASLSIDATFTADTPLALRIRDTFDIDQIDEDQLILPLLGEEPFRPQRDVVLSIRPQYSEKIIEGKKTVELRRRFPISAPSGTIAYIYSTSPVRAMVGVAEIKDVLKLPVGELWKRYESSAFIEKTDFDRYFEGTNQGFALIFQSVKALTEPLSLKTLRERFGFEPPQSFLYAKHDLRRALEHESTIVSH